MLEIFGLARRRHRSPDDYRAMQEFIAAKTIDELARRGVSLADSDVLELAAGPGGYSKILHGRSKTFLANDLNANAFFAENSIPLTVFDVIKRFPLKSASFDVIYCSSLIEHVEDPGRLLRECRRVLRPEGTLYLSFPPFYSLAGIGGHGLQPYHFFGESLSLRLNRRLRGKDYQSYATMWGNWGLYPLTVDRVARLIGDNGFHIVDTYTRLSPINTTRLPGLLKDLATWHICYLGRPKPDDQVT